MTAAPRAIAARGTEAPAVRVAETHRHVEGLLKDALFAGAHRFHRLLRPQSGHAGRDHDSTSRAGCIGKERQIDHIHGGDFDERHVEFVQKVDLLGERRLNKRRLPAPAVGGRLPMLLGGELICAHHLPQRAERFLSEYFRVTLVAFSRAMRRIHSTTGT